VGGLSKMSQTVTEKISDPLNLADLTGKKVSDPQILAVYIKKKIRGPLF
jgi:hypothetical protein